MFLRPHFRTVDGQRRACWALVESVRTERGPRQRVVAYLGGLDEAGRLGVQQAADPNAGVNGQPALFDDNHTQPRYVSVNVSKVRVENCRGPTFGRCPGGPWLAWQLIGRLGLDEFLEQAIPRGGEEIRWSVMALVLVIARLCRPSSELHIAEHFYRQTALADILGVPDAKVNDARLYRTLDALLPHKEALETGHAKITWQKIADRRDWAMLSAGCYLLRSNVRDWSDEELHRSVRSTSCCRPKRASRSASVA